MDEVEDARLKEEAGDVRPFLFVSFWAIVSSVVVFHPALLGRVLYFRDLARYFVPGKVVIAEALGRCEWPFWNPYVGMGAPLLADYGLGVGQPLNLLFLLFTPGTAITLFVLVHYPLSLLAMYAFLRSHRLSALAATVGATAYAFSGMAFCDAAHPTHLALYPLVPLLLFLAGSRASWRRRVLGTALLWALAVTTASAERLAVLGVLLPLYALVRGGIRSAARTVLGLALGTALVAPLWLPGMVFAATASARAGGFTWVEATANSLGPAQCAEMAWPLSLLDESGQVSIAALFGANFPLYGSVFCGSTAIFLAGASWASVRRGEDRERSLPRAEGVFWLGVFLLGMLLAMGRHSPLYENLFAMLPPLRGFRFPVKHVFFSGLAVSVLAAHGAEAWQRGWGGTARRLAVGLALLAAFALVALIGPDQETNAFQRGALRDAMPQAAVFLAVTLATLGARTSLPGVRLVLPAVVFFELVAAGGRFAPFTGPEFYEPSAMAKLIGAERFTSDKSWWHAPPPELTARGVSTQEILRQGLAADFGAIWGLRQADWYGGLEPHYARSCAGLLEGEDAGAAEKAGALAIAWRMRSASAMPLPPPWRLAAVDPLTGVALYRNTAVQPRARLATGEAAVVREDCSTVEVSVRCTAPDRLLLADPMLPGWTATLDGVPLPITGVRPVGRVVSVPPGEHRVLFRYEPPGWSAGWVAALAGALGCGVVAWRSRKERNA